jgi:hypothetical protein
MLDAVAIATESCRPIEFVHGSVERTVSLAEFGFHKAGIIQISKCRAGEFCAGPEHLIGAQFYFVLLALRGIGPRKWVVCRQQDWRFADLFQDYKKKWGWCNRKRRPNGTWQPKLTE